VLAALGDLMALINMIIALTVSWAAVDKMWCTMPLFQTIPAGFFRNLMTFRRPLLMLQVTGGTGAPLGPTASPAPSTSPSLPGLSPEPSLSPGLSPSLSPEPGASPALSPEPGLSPSLSPEPGASPALSPEPGLSPGLTPSPSPAGPGSYGGTPPTYGGPAEAPPPADAEAPPPANAEAPPPVQMRPFHALALIREPHEAQCTTAGVTCLNTAGMGDAPPLSRKLQCAC
jgi:hypothetical protein